jgi:hypothetical protein
MSETPRKRNLLRTAVLSAVTLLTVTSAALADPQSKRAYSADHACTVDLGLDRLTGDYAACVGSLNGALSTSRGVRSPYSIERQACIDIGLDPRSQAVDQCAANLRASLWNQGILDGD